MRCRSQLLLQVSPSSRPFLPMRQCLPETLRSHPTCVLEHGDSHCMLETWHSDKLENLKADSCMAGALCKWTCAWQQPLERLISFDHSVNLPGPASAAMLTSSGATAGGKFTGTTVTARLENAWHGHERACSLLAVTYAGTQTSSWGSRKWRRTTSPAASTRSSAACAT